jgi:hypothetical protein
MNVKANRKKVEKGLNLWTQRQIERSKKDLDWRTKIQKEKSRKELKLKDK